MLYSCLDVTHFSISISWSDDLGLFECDPFFPFPFHGQPDASMFCFCS